MCKLLAYVNNEKTISPAVGLRINKAIQHLFYINSYGQTDGSGLMWMTPAGTTSYLKDSVPSTTLMNFKAFDTIKPNLYTHKFLAGHTRYSTVGSNSWENTHPFHYGNYMGMQNGTISSDHKSLVTTESSPCAVDSASVIWAFNKQGVQKTLANYEGEGVFLFFDLAAKTFNIVKNKHRTLHRMQLEGLNIYLYSTDKSALLLVADRAGIVDVGPIEAVPNDTLLTFGLDNTLVETPLVIPEPSFSIANYYSARTGYTPPKYTPPATYTLPAKSSARDTRTGPAYNAYVCDCDMCGSPLFAQDTIFADQQNLTFANYIACKSCVQTLEQTSGTALSRVPYAMKGIH